MKDSNNVARVYCLDASIYVFRAWFAVLNSPQEFPNDKALIQAALLVYSRHLRRFIQTQSVQYCVAAFDESLHSGFRHTLCDDYKSNRALPDPVLKQYLQSCKKLTQALGIKSLASKKYEADDIVATLAQCVKNFNKQSDNNTTQVAVSVVTRDKDLCQLILDETDEWLDISKLDNLQRMLADDVVQRFGVRSNQIADFLALRGDAIDGVQGIQGVGDKTAALLLNHYQSLKQLIDEAMTIADQPIRSAALIQQRILDGKTLLLKNQQLTTLVDNISEIQNQFSCLDDFLLIDKENSTSEVSGEILNDKALLASILTDGLIN